MNLEGWSSPGRGVHEKLHAQIYGILSYLNDVNKIGNDLWSPKMQEKIGATIDVHEASTVRHIIGFMKSIGVIYEDSLEGGKVPDPNYCVTQSGEVFYSLIKMEKIANENKESGLEGKVMGMLQYFYAHVFLYWFVRDTNIHVARTVLKAIKKHNYIDKMEWFIMNTFISVTDNLEQERLVEKHINDYRAGDLKLTAEAIVKQKNSYNYWVQLLVFAGLINKVENKLYLGNRFPELIAAILAEDFLAHLDVTLKYRLGVGREE